MKKISLLTATLATALIASVSVLAQVSPTELNTPMGGIRRAALDVAARISTPVYLLPTPGDALVSGVPSAKPGTDPNASGSTSNTGRR